jgi:predicted nucleic acid-binding Zn ribbon protein
MAGNEYTLKEAIEALMKRYRLQEGMTAHKAKKCWEEVAGPFIASKTRHVQFKEGVLTIAVESPALRQELHMSRSTIQEQMNRHLGKDTIAEVRIK